MDRKIIFLLMFLLIPGVLAVSSEIDSSIPNSYSNLANSGWNSKIGTHFNTTYSNTNITEISVIFNNVGSCGSFNAFIYNDVGGGVLNVSNRIASSINTLSGISAGIWYNFSFDNASVTDIGRYWFAMDCASGSTQVRSTISGLSGENAEAYFDSGAGSWLILNNRRLGFKAYGQLFSVPSNVDFNYTNVSFPEDNNSFALEYMNFSQEAYLVNNSVDCSLFLNGVENGSVSYSDLTNETYFFNITFDRDLTAPGEYNWSVSCWSNITSEYFNTSEQTFYLDIINPSISTNFVNRSVWYENIWTQINFSDDFYLNSYNISIDGVEVDYNGSLTGTSAQLNFSYDIANLTPGAHNLTIKLADGHTAHQIPDYEVSNGLFNDYLQYSWKDKSGKSKKVKISHADGSLLDSFSTTKKFDRYTWDFEPSEMKDNYVFNIETDDPIRIIEDNSTYLKSWITFGDKWIDFDLFGENSSVKVTRLNDKFVKVKVSNIKNPGKQKYQSIGDLNIIEAYYTFYKLNASVTYQSIVFEGSITPLNLNLYMSDLLDFNTSSNLVWNNVSQNISRTNVSDDELEYDSTILVPSINDTNVSWVWYFNVSDGVFNISGMSEWVEMNITNCSAGNYVVLNYTIYDEETKVISGGINASIENFLTLTTPNFEESYYNFTIQVDSPNLLICLPNNTLANSSFILDALTKYEYEDHVEEFHYIENFLLTSSNIPKVINLYDLKSSDSTSFLVTYQDENYLYVEDVIVDLLRQYTSENGEFYSVEHGKTDQGGQTRLHFVTEDVVYKANVWQDGTLVYTSGEFFALCQTTPCQINLRQPYSVGDLSNLLDNLVYDISSQKYFYDNKKIVFDWSTNDGTSVDMNLIVTKTSSLMNDTICNSTKVLSAGSIVCNIPLTYYNATYTARLFMDDEFLGWRIYSMEPSPEDTFGDMGIFLSGIGYLLLAFMGIASATASVVLGIVGLMAMISMNLLDGGSLFGLGSTFIWLLIAGGILIYKYQQRRVQ